jgi:hypothetical protein
MFSVADMVPGFGAFLTPGSGIGKQSGSRTEMNNPYRISESFENCFFGVKTLKFFDSDPGSGMETLDLFIL